MKVNLEKDALEMGLSPKLFAMLKQANPARFDILQDLLKRVGLDCTNTENVALTACILYGTSEVRPTAK